MVRLQELVQWVVLAVAVLVSYSCFLAADVYSIYDNSLTLWRGIVHGHSVLDYFEYNVEYARTFWAANYTFVCYALVALWNLPVALYAKVRGIDYLDSTFGYLWMKLLLLTCLVIAIVLMCRILDHAGFEKRVRQSNAFMFLACPATIMSALIYANIEIIPICFMLAGILFLIQGRQGWFLFFFAMGGACKFFAFLLVIPLLLLVEQHFVRGLLKMGASTILVVFERALFSGHDAYRYAQDSQNGPAVEVLFTANAGRTALFVVAMIVICSLCHLNRKTKLAELGPLRTESMDQSQCRTVFYACFAVFGSFVTFANIRPYWILLVIPFLMLVCATAGNTSPFLYALETLGLSAYTLHTLIIYFSFDAQGIVTHSLLPRLVTLPDPSIARYASTSAFFRSLSLKEYAPGLWSVYVGCLLVLAILAVPPVEAWLKSKAWRDGCMTPLARWGSLGMSVFLVAAAILPYLATTNPLIFSNLGANAEPANVNLIEDDGHTVSQEISFAESTSLNTLRIRFKNQSKVINNFSLVTFKLVRVGDDTNMFEKTIGAGLIPDGEGDSKAVLSLSLDGVEVRPNTLYEIQIVGHPGTLSNTSAGFSISPYVVSGSPAGLRVDDKPQPGILQYEIR